jgi:hypothetical protein
MEKAAEPKQPTGEQRETHRLDASVAMVKEELHQPTAQSGAREPWCGWGRGARRYGCLFTGRIE